jgi:hypothetical protein
MRGQTEGSRCVYWRCSASRLPRARLRVSWQLTSGASDSLYAVFGRHCGDARATTFPSGTVRAITAQPSRVRSGPIRQRPARVSTSSPRPTSRGSRATVVNASLEDACRRVWRGSGSFISPRCPRGLRRGGLVSAVNPSANFRFDQMRLPEGSTVELWAGPAASTWSQNAHRRRESAVRR